MWFPQPGHQLAAFEADWCPELFYGGERGGGKSDYQIGYQEDGALRYGNAHRGIMFRKTYPELEELQARAMQVFPAEGAVYKTQPSADYPFSNCWYWPSGASVKMRFIESERDYGRYHGHQYTRISFDEVTEYATAAPLLKMLSTLRSPNGVPCSVRLTGNPGGVGHIWVKSRYIDVAKAMTPYEDPESKIIRMYVPSAMADNVILLREDPAYRNRIIAATNGNEALRKAWLEGDWNIVAGAFFDRWNTKLHVVRPFAIPDDWGRIRSGDWGSARPFSFGWWAVATDDYPLESGLIIPRGAMVRYREWYGCKDRINEPNVGIKLPAEEVGRRLWELERDDPRIADAVLDPAAFAQDGGPSIAERIASGAGNKLWFRRADNRRTAHQGAMGGWDQMRARLEGEDGVPRIYCFDNCLDSIRTIPLMQHDPIKIEDLDTDMEDHCFAKGTLVRTLEGNRAIETLTTGHVLTKGGVFVPFRSGGLIKRNSRLVRVKFSNGACIDCTPDHRFLVDTDEWRYAKDLEGEIVQCAPSSFRKPSKNINAFASTNAGLIFSERGTDSIVKFGKTISDLFLLEIRSTTETGTRVTIPLKTWNVSRSMITWALDMGRRVGKGESPLFPLQSLLRLFGINRRLALPGIALTMSGLDQNSNARPGKFASFAGKALNVLLRMPRVQNGAAQNAKPVRCVSVEELTHLDDVYCITVPITGCFALASGILVSNCADEWRYACMSRPYVRRSAESKKPRFLHEITANEVFWPERSSKKTVIERI